MDLEVSTTYSIQKWDNIHFFQVHMENAQGVILHWATKKDSTNLRGLKLCQVSSEHNGMKLKINYRKKEWKNNVQRLNNMLFKKWVNEKEIRQLLGTNKSKFFQDKWYTAKAVLRGIPAYFKRKEKNSNTPPHLPPKDITKRSKQCLN